MFKSINTNLNLNRLSINLSYRLIRNKVIKNQNLKDSLKETNKKDDKTVIDKWIEESDQKRLLEKDKFKKAKKSTYLYFNSINKSDRNDFKNNLSSFNNLDNQDNRQSSFNFDNQDKQPSFNLDNQDKRQSSINNLNNLNNQDNQSPINDLDNQFNKQSLDNDKLIQEIDKCEKLTNLFNLIDPIINNLKAHHIEKIYEKINYLYFHLQKPPTNVFYKDIERSIKMTSTFKQLTDHTLNSIEQLNLKCLSNAFQTYSLMKFSAESRILDSILQSIAKKIKQSNLIDKKDLLLSLYYYEDKRNSYKRSTTNFKLPNSYEEHFLFKLKDDLLFRVYCDLKNYSFTDDEIDLLIDFIEIYSKLNLLETSLMENQEIITFLLNQIKLNGLNLDFKQSIRLMKWFKKMRFIRKQHEFNLLPFIYYETIELCNNLIFNHLNLNSTDDHCFNYLIYELHDYDDTANLNIKQYYDQRILELLSKFIINNQAKQNRFHIFNISYNHFRLGVYDEQLIRLTYELILKDEYLRIRINRFQAYYLFARFRLPFIDYDRLSKLLFDLSFKFEKSINFGTLRLKTLTQIIMTDIRNNDKLYYYFINSINRLNDDQLRTITFQLYMNIILSKIYLAKFSKLDFKIRIQLENCLDKLINKLSIIIAKKLIDTEFLSKNNRLQQNAYLTNGLLLNVFAIYDKNLKDLIPLDDYKSYFHKIDQLKLKSDQQLITFIATFNEKKYFKNYEYNHDFILKKVLNSFNFEVIEVGKEEFIGLTTDEKVDFFYRKILDHCQL